MKTGILSEFIYRLNPNILSFSDDITFSQKVLFFHTFSFDLRCKRIKTI